MKPRSVKPGILYNGNTADAYFTDAMTDFEYSDSTEESDAISITINDPNKLWSGSWMPINGDKIQATINLMNWDGSEQIQSIRCGDFIVDSFQISAPPQKLMIDGVSSPVNLDFKETKRTQTWEKVTIYLIAAEIAARYGLTLVYDTAQEVTLEREEQNEKTDSAYLKDLCNKYGLGLKIYASQIVIWSYEEYEAKEPILTIRPQMIQKLDYKGSMQGTYTGVKVTYSDAKKDNTLETFVGQDGRILNVNEKAESIADAERIGKNALRKANQKEITLNLTIIPTIQIAASCTVRVEGFNKIDGRYFVMKVNHRISRKDYKMQLNMYRINTEG